MSSEMPNACVERDRNRRARDRAGGLGRKIFTFINPGKLRLPPDGQGRMLVSWELARIAIAVFINS